MSSEPNADAKRPGKKHLRVVAERQAAAAAGLAPAAAPAPKRARLPGGTPVAPVRTKKPKTTPARGRVTRRRKARSATVSFLLIVCLPVIAAAVYLFFIAADQYHSEARFALRGTESSPTDLVGMLTGSPSGGSNVSDSYIIQQYVQSREMVEAVQATVDLEAVYNRPEADFYARMGTGLPIEGVLSYWTSMVSAQFDAYSGILTLEVRAFRPDDAQVIAAAVVRESEALVNRLADKARSDAISFAQKELEFAEWRLQDARRALIQFQSAQSTLDPGAAAAANEALVSGLRTRLADAQSELAGLLEFVGAEAPTVRVLKTRIAALEAQIEAERRKVGGFDADGAAGGDGLSDQLAGYQELKTAEEFAQQVYLAALKGLESARANAKRNHAYLATFVQPMASQEPQYPRRVADVLLVLAIAFGVWAIGGLMYAAVRDHVA